MLYDLFSDPDKIEAIFLKVLTANEIGEGLSKRGVVIPVGAYRFFPEFPGFNANPDRNYSLALVGKGVIGDRSVQEAFSYKHYQRYPERRLTRLSPFAQDSAEGSVLILGRRADGLHEIVHIHPGDPRYRVLLKSVGLSEAQPGTYFLDLAWQPDIPIERSSYEEELLKRFIQIRDRGFVPAISNAPSAVGSTFESLLEIAPNNYPGPDYGDIEIKCHEMDVARDEAMDLFLKEPDWMDGLSQKVRIRRYGYWDAENGRHALYSSVKREPNSLDLEIHNDRNNQRLLLERSGIAIGEWEHVTLEERLKEKLTHAVMVGARVNRRDDQKEFHYLTLTLLSAPSVGGFLEQVELSQAWLEIRMHFKDGSSVRNHGSQFRVKQGKLDRIFSRVLAYQS